MSRTFENDLKQELQNEESAKYFGAAQAKSSFAITLVKARKAKGLTQQELARLAGVSQAYIAKLEGGEVNPTLERVGSLLAVLGFSLTTGTTALSPYPEAQTFEINWHSDAWLMPPAMEYLSFTTDISQRKEVISL
jgi:transcriptional regulator with XRE-family HTH domain